MTDRQAVFAAAAKGLGGRPRRLPPWLSHDSHEAARLEAVARPPVSELARAERELLERRGPELVARAARQTPLTVVELGAGAAQRTQGLLLAAVRHLGPCRYIPVDASAAALESCRARLAREAPEIEVLPVRGPHEAALPAIRATDGTVLVLFVGNAIGRLSDTEAAGLLCAVSDAMRPGAALVLGTDRKAPPERLLAGYDDSSGGPRAELEVLTRLNRELGADFDPRRWRQVARWNPPASRVELHLVSLSPQQVHVPGLPTLEFDRGETIHTESSVKYDLPHVERLLDAAGLEREVSFTDARSLFDLHLARRA